MGRTGNQGGTKRDCCSVPGPAGAVRWLLVMLASSATVQFTGVLAASIGSVPVALRHTKDGSYRYRPRPSKSLTHLDVDTALKTSVIELIGAGGNQPGQPAHLLVTTTDDFEENEPMSFVWRTCAKPPAAATPC
jgi:hypothetical protein